MILVDANFLIYASIGDFSQHRAARDWLDRQLNGSARVGLPWSSLLAFRRIVTNYRALVAPLAMEDPWGQVTGWLRMPAGLVFATDRTTRLNPRSVARLPAVRANLIHDPFFGGARRRTRTDPVLYRWRCRPISSAAMAEPLQRNRRLRRQRPALEGGGHRRATSSLRA